MNQKSVRKYSTLAATAAIALAVAAVFAFSVGSSGVLRAQSTSTTSIDLLNVGMCVTTDDSVFKESDCDDGSTGTDTDFTVGDRDEIVERDSVYATYAHDPISGSEQPRAILHNSDLIQVTITDKGRDRRRSVLYPAAISAALDYSGIMEYTAGTSVLDDDSAPVNTKIKQLIDGSPFKAMLQDEDQINGWEDDEIVLYNQNQSGGTSGIEATAAVVENSGNATFNFKRDASQPFLPLSDDEVNDAVIFFGFEVGTGAEVTTYGAVDDVVGVRANIQHLQILGAGSSRSLIADEDRNSGGGNIPPWLTVLANVTSGRDLVIVAVLYETSDQEVIQGGVACDEITTGENMGDCKVNSAQADDRPNYTTAEISNKQALIARVQGDNGYIARNLYLKETGRFTGKYTGYIRLTDANGNGGADSPPSASNPADWGIELDHADDETVDGAAVVGLQDGPATITYKDSGGATRTMNIEVDIQSPTITIASPAHDSSGDDRSPDFIGTFEDGGAGLADDTFKLYVDNVPDSTSVVGDSIADTDPVLEIPTGTGFGLKSSKTTAQLRRDYADGDVFGVIKGVAGDGTGSIYFTETGDEDDPPAASESENDAERKFINADIYDDGDGQATFDDDARIEGDDTNGREISVDFQAVVIDLAGNIGFSDSDPARPSFINDLGTAPANRQDPPPNVLGMFSRHVILLDDKDPVFEQDHTVTGFYGLDSDDDPVPHRRGIMITFDNDISPDNITENTFTVELDDKSQATVEDVLVSDNLVFLRLADDMNSNETPSIGIAEGQRVEDFAGNQTQAREVKSFEAKDGIAPTLSVSLSNGSGTGTGSESSESLTKNTIVVSVTSDELIQGAPYVAVVCDNFNYLAPTTTTPRLDTDDLVASRTGALTSSQANPTLGSVIAMGRCGTGTSAQTYNPVGTQMYSRPDLNWEYTWSNRAESGPSSVPNGKVRVVVYARDRSTYQLPDQSDTLQNWGVADTSFTLDSDLLPLVKGTTIDRAAGSVLPTPNQKVAESRPFVILDFSGENTQVTIKKLEVDDVDVTSRIDSNQRNRFIYWPEGLNFGDHTVEVEAVDAAGNEETFKWDFEVTSRSAFVIELLAGWNAVSLPYHPVDSSIESAFSNPSIDTVIGWDAADPDSPWRLAMRRNGIWTTNEQYGTLTEVSAGYGYWVHSQSFVSQSIPIRSRERLGGDIPTPVDIPTHQGWNFVGVVDQDGDQTQNHFGQSLLTGSDPQTASDYLGSFVRAYTWDATFNRFDTIEKTTTMTIGDGVWVFYGNPIAP